MVKKEERVKRTRLKPIINERFDGGKNSSKVEYAIVLLIVNKSTNDRRSQKSAKALNRYERHENAQIFVSTR